MRTPRGFEGKLVRGAHALPIVRGFKMGTNPILKAERAELWKEIYFLVM